MTAAHEVGGGRGAGAANGLAVIVGSGMGAVVDRLEERLGQRLSFRDRLRFEDIDGVGACTVAGHNGTVLVADIGDLASRDQWRLVLVRGRRHVYEGGRFGMPGLMRRLAQWGVGEVVAVSAAGSVRETLHPGQLVVIQEIMDMQNRERLQPHLRGARRSGRSDRPPIRLRTRLSARLTRDVEAAAGRAAVSLARGTLACAAGPAYETPAEIRALQAMGVDVVSMSAAPEVELAAEIGMDVAAVAAITNPGTGIGRGRPDHGRVLEVAAAMSGSLADVLAELVDRPVPGSKKRL